MRAAALPRELIEVLEKKEDLLRDLRQGKYTQAVEDLYKTLLNDCVNWLKDLKGSFWSKQRTEQLKYVFHSIQVPCLVDFPTSFLVLTLFHNFFPVFSERSCVF